MPTSTPHIPVSGRALSAAFAVLLAGFSSTQAQTVRTWSATPADGDWNDTANWSGGAVPVNGDRVTFGASTVTTLNNDISGLTLVTPAAGATTDTALYFAAGASAYTLTGNAMSLKGDVAAGANTVIRNVSTSKQTFNLDLELATVNSGNGQTVEMTTAGDLEFNGAITVSSLSTLAVNMASSTSRTVTFNGAIALSNGNGKGLSIGGNLSNQGGVYTFNNTITSAKTSTSTLSVSINSGTTNINAATIFTSVSGARTLNLMTASSASVPSATLNINHAGAFEEFTEINILQSATNATNGGTGPASLLVGANGWATSAEIKIGTNANAGASVIIGGKSGLGTTGVATFSGNVTALDSNTDRARTVTFTTPEGRVNFTGVISTAAAGASVLSVNKTGAGIVAVSGANTYTGGTAVGAGTFLLNNVSGSATGSVGVLTVASGARLAGFGSTASAATIDAGARVTAGDIASGSTAPTIDTVTQGNNTLTFSQSLTINGAYDWYLGAASESVGFTQLDVSGGSLTLGGTSSFALTTANFVNGLNPDSADSFWNSNRSWVIADVSGSTSIAGSFGTVDLGTWANGSFSLDFAGGTGNDLVLNWTAAAIPEPSTYAALAGMVMLGGAALRRRRG